MRSPRRLLAILAISFAALTCAGPSFAQIVVAPLPDSGAAVAGTASAAIVNVAANDTVDGAPAILGASGNATIAEIGTWPAGLNLDPIAGAISTTNDLPPGYYSVQYQLCDLMAPPDCASTTDTIVVTAAIAATPESGTAIAGMASTPIINVAANDTINGAAATLGSAGNATIAEVGTWATGLSLDPIAGAISTTSALPPGTYVVQYQLCDLMMPPDCANTTDTIVVTAAILATPESGNAVAGIASIPIVNVAANDTVNGASATLGSSGNSTVAQAEGWPAGLSLNPATGAIAASATVQAGTYDISYQLCDLLAPPDCASATDVVSVTAPAVSIIAVPEAGRADAGIASTAIAHVAANDTINGAPATLGSSGNATVAKSGSWPNGITLAVVTGAVTTSTALAPGVYNISYKLCDKNKPPNCATTTDTVNVIAASIDATSASGSATAGVASTPIAGVTENDMVDGSLVTLGTSGDATIAKVGAWPAGVSLSTVTGAVTAAATVAPGTYSIQYKLCDKNVPPDCATATDTIVISPVSILAAPDTGSALVGSTSIPIAHVTANDTIDGGPVTLGASGNAAVTKVGVWPSGIMLTAATGAISTSATVAPGTYSVAYQLCDKRKPPDCAVATDTITVLAIAIVPVADSGTAILGVSSTPIVSVTANDSVNGAPAVLGSSGNATVAKVGTWPAGIALSTTTGAVTVAASVGAGTYSVEYRLCDKNKSPDCATTTDTITVSAASVAPVPDSGSAVAGTLSSPIANVASNDTVNGAAAMLGPSGNATVAQIGSWPAGIALNTATGAITSASSVPIGLYQVQYQLCDLNTPAHCASATDTVMVVPVFTEVQVSNLDFGDIEFDWGRDGVYCASCNFGQGNARFNWADPNGNIWLGHVDPNTGAFTPPAGNNELVDTTDLYVLNGPEWAFSTQNGQVISQLIYTRYPPGQQPTNSNATVAFATPSAGGWIAEFLPGAGPASGGVNNTVDPIATQCNTDTTPLALFNDLANPQDVYWEAMTDAAGTAPTLTPFGSFFSDVSGGKPAQRWVPCTHQLVFVGNAPPDGSGNVNQQVFWYDADTQVVQQLTNDSRGETEAFMFQAPELGDAYIVYTVAGNTEIDIYEQTGVGDSGAPTLQLINQITSPDPAEPYISSTEPFIHCTPTCQSYIFMKLSSQVITPENRRETVNGVAVANINPAQPLFQILVPEWVTPTTQRTDLEYYITNQGAYLYYGISTISSPSGPARILGHYYIDMQLGVPSGPCIGSSAEGGMIPGC